MAAVLLAHAALRQSLQQSTSFDDNDDNDTTDHDNEDGINGDLRLQPSNVTDLTSYLEVYGLTKYEQEVQEVAVDVFDISYLDENEIKQVADKLPTEAKRRAWNDAVLHIKNTDRKVSSLLVGNSNDKFNNYEFIEQNQDNEFSCDDDKEKQPSTNRRIVTLWDRISLVPPIEYIIFTDHRMHYKSHWIEAWDGKASQLKANLVKLYETEFVAGILLMSVMTALYQVITALDVDEDHKNDPRYLEFWVWTLASLNFIINIFNIGFTYVTMQLILPISNKNLPHVLKAPSIQLMLYLPNITLMLNFYAFMLFGILTFMNTMGLSVYSICLHIIPTLIGVFFMSFFNAYNYNLTMLSGTFGPKSIFPSSTGHHKNQKRATCSNDNNPNDIQYILETKALENRELRYRPQELAKKLKK